MSLISKSRGRLNFDRFNYILKDTYIQNNVRRIMRHFTNFND